MSPLWIVKLSPIATRASGGVLAERYDDDERRRDKAERPP